MESSRCYHCGELIPAGFNQSVDILGKARHMCCIGCVEVAKTIVQSGLTDYYQHRTNNAPSAQGLVPDALQQLIQYDDDAVQQEFVADQGEYQEVLLSVEGISCAACAWLIEKQVAAIPGVLKIAVNSTTFRATLRWDKRKCELSKVLQSIHTLGYQAAPFQVDQQEQRDRKLYRSYLLRLGLAGLATMQVMMFAIALYGDFFGDMELIYRDYFRWVSLILATPVLLYSAQPFYSGAYRSIRAGTLNMDVPVSIALLGAYSASLYATVRGTGEVYFESVSMFTFLLLLGRTLELRARRKASESSSNMLKLVPKVAQRVNSDGQLEQVAASQLHLGDTIMIRPGETIPADGDISEGHSQIDESMLSGESLPQDKRVGDAVYAGSINHQQTIKVSVTAVAQNTFVAHLLRMQESAAVSKNRTARFADLVARYFVAALIAVAIATYSFWHWYSPEDAFWITLSVLVATCPCALSLATPTALTVATHRLAKQGFLVKQGHVLELLSKLTQLVSDKTGTLTEGRLQLISTEALAELDETNLNLIAATLESHTTHPIAHAFASTNQNLLQAEQFTHLPGFGIAGSIDCVTYRLGGVEQEPSSVQTSLVLGLYRGEQLLGRFYLADNLREGAKEFAQELEQRGINLSLLTGDKSGQVSHVANALAIADIKSGVLPEDKLTHVQALASEHPATAMLGDGVNDGPVLAGAPLSIAMGMGSDVAKSSADAILVRPKLSVIVDAIDLAQRCRSIIRQNFAWALGYNGIILPLAVCGFVPPYLAALGMSLSSLIVLANSLRLGRL
ncbi:heavy metal translocating P-type ATPase [Aliagarivorans marinus]|uniref:heavy metal translocating P-type ATPase n=1 Tax=Aliagarivorans marinus TaxID=561965 RepID=UPI000478E113|nr:heavy metal translocating P-type ATPase [Aliagarivorans marinus]